MIASLEFSILIWGMVVDISLSVRYYYCAYCFVSTYRKTSSISRTKFPNLNASCLVLWLSSPNPLKPGAKSIMKM